GIRDDLVTGVQTCALPIAVSKDHACGRGAEKFKQLVAEATKGQVDVQVHHANALGAIREGLEMVRLGTLDFQLCGVAHVSRFVRSEERRVGEGRSRVVYGE